MNGTLSDYWKHGAIVAAAMVGFLLAATTTLAATIEKDGDTATAIRDLQIGSITYDVSFLRTTAPAIYPPGSFDFNNALTAEVAVDAVVAVFNADGSVLGVGEGASNPSEYFFVPYDTFDIEINPPGEGGVRIHFLRVWEGYTGNPDQPGSWVSGDILDATPLLTGATYAKFIVVDTGGSGNSPPVADAGDGPYTGVINTAVSFDGSGSSDPDGTIVDYQWDFSGGQSGSGEKPSFVYSTPGIKNVTLTVTDDGNRSNTDSVYAIIGNDSGQPVADAGGPYRGTVGAAVNFDGSESYDPDGKIAKWEWDFADGNMGSGPTPKHIYEESGSYKIELTVTDDSGETDNVFEVAIIGTGNLPPVANAGGSYIGAAGVPKTFDGTGSFDLDGDIVAWDWDFGDGNNGTGPTPTHTYATQGSYGVSLTVTDDDDAISSAETTAVMGGPDPAPDDRLVDLVTLGDVAGGPSADLAVLDVVLANGDALSETVHVYGGGTGAKIYDVVLSDSWRSLAIDQATTVTGQRLAILQTDVGGDIRVRLLNASDGTTEQNVPYFDNTWTPIDILNVRDAGGPGIEGIGVLAENRAGQQAIEVRSATTGALVNQVLYFNDVWKASYAVDLGEFNGNGISEMSVLATNNAGKHAVETRDALSGKQISRYFFLGPTNTMKGLAQSADVDGNGKPELIVLGNKDAANATANTAQVKDVKTDALVSKPGSFAPPFVGFALRSMEDADGNTSPEMVIGAFDDEGNVTRVQVRDVLNGTLTLNTGILSAAFDPKDLEILEDVSGNGIQELVAAGLNRDTLAIRVQTRDGQTGALLLNIDVN